MVDFVSRQQHLQVRLLGLKDGEGFQGNFNHFVRIEERQQVLQEAEACFELYEQFDNGDEILERREKRRLAGLSIDPTPSSIKCWAWCHLKLARHYLAQAYIESGAFELALPLYHLLVDQCLRMRTEIWDDNHTDVPTIMNDLSACYCDMGQFESAREWLEKGMHLWERDGLDELYQTLKTNFAQIAGTNAGPMAPGDAANSKKQWKKCWWCGKKETKDQKLRLCSKCVHFNVATPAYYCSRKCQEQDWQRHKGYHKTLKDESKKASESIAMSAEERRFLQEHEGDEYTQLLFQSRQAQIDGNQIMARRLAEKAIKMDPRNPSAYNTLANIFRICHNYQGKIQCQLEVMDIVDNKWSNVFHGNAEPEFIWAEAAVSIFSTCYHNPAATSLLDNKPDWILDPEKQLRVAKRACRALPDQYLCWLMRADASKKMGKLDQAIQQYSVANEMAESSGKSTDKIVDEIRRVQQQQQQQHVR